VEVTELATWRSARLIETEADIGVFVIARKAWVDWLVGSGAVGG
jgi:hypothetical protein